jgi:HAD superfamily hydrolase (TIGR01509 family)
MGARALIFDYDGLVVDSERMLADAVIEVVTERGGSAAYTDFGHLFGTLDADHLWAELVPRWCEGLTFEEMDREVWRRLPDRVERLPPLPGVRELMEVARADGWFIALGTGATLSSLERRLLGGGLADAFDVIVTRAEVALGKPAPDIFVEVARRLAVEPAECLVLEDSPHGCEAALAAGMRVIACPSIVNAHCEFPPGVPRVSSLFEVRLPPPLG